MPFSWRRPLLHFFEGSPHHELKPQIRLRADFPRPPAALSRVALCPRRRDDPGNLRALVRGQLTVYLRPEIAHLLDQFRGIRLGKRYQSSIGRSVGGVISS
jgi:hypothetical protein